MKSFDVCTAFTVEYRGRSMVYLHQENDRFPRSWIDLLKQFDVVLSPSPHMTRVLADGSCPVEVVEMPLSGVDPTVFNPRVEPLADFFPGRFKFLMVAAAQPRKNTATLIRVFRERFGDRDDTILVLKSGGYGEDAEHRALIGDSANIALLSEEVPDDVLASMYRSVAVHGAYVHPHRAECVGMPVIEALAVGCRTAVTNWGGPRHLPDTPLLTRLPFALVPSSFMNQPGSALYEPDECPLWAEPFEAALGDWMESLNQAGPAIDVECDRGLAVRTMYSYERLTAQFHRWLIAR